MGVLGSLAMGLLKGVMNVGRIGGVGQCGVAANCGGGGGRCGIAANCSGGGGRCGIGANCSGS